MSIVEFDGLPSWSLDASKPEENTKMPVGRGGGVNSVGGSPQFRSHQDTKVAARRTQRSTSTISRKNRRL